MSLIYQTFENSNRRTAESASGGQIIEVKNIVLLPSKTPAVSAGGGLDIVLRTPHPAERSPVSILRIQERLNHALSCSNSSARYIALGRTIEL